MKHKHRLMSEKCNGSVLRTYLVDVKDEIELADVLEALVERLDQHLDEVEDAQLRLG